MVADFDDEFAKLLAENNEKDQKVRRRVQDSYETGLVIGAFYTACRIQAVPTQEAYRLADGFMHSTLTAQEYETRAKDEQALYESFAELAERNLIEAKRKRRYWWLPFRKGGGKG